MKTPSSLFWERPLIFRFDQLEDVNEATLYFTCHGSDIPVALKGGNIMKSSFEEAKEPCLWEKSTAGFKNADSSAEI